MKSTLTLFVCLVLSGCFVPSIRADPLSADPKERAHQLLDRSLIQNRDDHPRAIQTAQEALALFKSVNDLDGIASAYALIGQYNYAQNAMAESGRYYDLALQAWRQLSNLQGQARALIMFGYIEGRKGEWLNGISYLTQAHNLIDEARDPVQMAQFASGLGYVFNESGCRKADCRSISAQWSITDKQTRIAPTTARS
jgi:tetratricopeptide (TPR) repeat protein